MCGDVAVHVTRQWKCKWNANKRCESSIFFPSKFSFRQLFPVPPSVSWLGKTACKSEGGNRHSPQPRWSHAPSLSRTFGSGQPLPFPHGSTAAGRPHTDGAGRGDWAAAAAAGAVWAAACVGAASAAVGGAAGEPASPQVVLSVLFPYFFLRRVGHRSVVLGSALPPPPPPMLAQAALLSY